MKYRPYPFAKAEELVYDNGTFKVYHAKQLGRYYLVRDGIELGFKNACYVDTDNNTKEPNYERWYAEWQARIRKRYTKIESLITELRHEKAELFDMISNEGK